VFHFGPHESYASTARAGGAASKTCDQQQSAFNVGREAGRNHADKDREAICFIPRSAIAVVDAPAQGCDRFRLTSWKIAGWAKT